MKKFNTNNSYDTESFGKHIKKDLIPNGNNIPVTEDNKFEFVQARCYERLAKDI